MSYSDGLNFLLHGTAIEGEASNADVVDYDFPCPVSIEQFGILCTEDADIAGSNAAIFSLDLSSTIAEGDRTEKATITTPKANTGQGGAVGECLYSNDIDFPIKVPAGGRVTLEHKQSASDAGGAWKPFIVYRVDGIDNDSAKQAAS